MSITVKTSFRYFLRTLKHRQGPHLLTNFDIIGGALNLCLPKIELQTYWQAPDISIRKGWWSMYTVFSRAGVPIQGPPRFFGIGLKNGQGVGLLQHRAHLNRKSRNRASFSHARPLVHSIKPHVDTFLSSGNNRIRVIKVLFWKKKIRFFKNNILFDFLSKLASSISLCNFSVQDANSNYSILRVMGSLRSFGRR